MTDSQLKQDLRAVRALFSGPEKWTKGVYARDAKGIPAPPRDQRACCWCLSGAMFIAAKEPEIFDVLLDLIKAPVTCDDEPEQELGVWNDAPERTFEEVIALVDKAIEAAP